MSTDTPLLEVRDLNKLFPLPGSKKRLQACQDVSFSLDRGVTLGVVGESGSGKTTLGRCVLRLIEPTAGSIAFNSHDLMGLSAKSMRKLRAKMQMVFQDPQDSFNPQMSLGRQVAEPLRIHTKLGPSERKAQVVELLALVGLPPTVAEAYPSSLSAGTLQRVSIARAIATSPDLIVLDEPTSALAPEAEADIVSVLLKLLSEMRVSYIWISHNLSLIGEVCQRIAVMYLSQIVEIGPTEVVFGAAQHPYSRALIASTLRPDPNLRREKEACLEKLEGEIPSPIDLPTGCYLASRCQYVRPRCQVEPQRLVELAPGHQVRCWRICEGDLLRCDDRLIDRA